MQALEEEAVTRSRGYGTVINIFEYSLKEARLSGRRYCAEKPDTLRAKRTKCPKPAAGGSAGDALLLPHSLRR